MAADEEFSLSIVPGTDIARHRCAVLTRERGEDPVGQATTYDRIILVELPKPWPRRAIDGSGASRALVDLMDGFQALRRKTLLEGGEAAMKARGLSVGLINVAPDPVYSAPGLRRVLHFHRPSGPFSAYDKEEYLAPEEDVADLLETLLYRRPTDRWDHALDRGAGKVRDLLVCTHGSRDTCCGTFGYPLYARLRHLGDSTGRVLRVWQATHFQRHRFAPVVLDLPEGRVWGGLTPDHAEALALRNKPPHTLRSYYIGWAGVEQGYMQVAEREALVQEGWAWTAYRKSGRFVQVDEAAERAQVHLAFASSDGNVTGSYVATVEVAEYVPALVGCLSPGQSRDAPQYRVADVRRSLWSENAAYGRRGAERTEDAFIPTSPCDV